MKNNTWKVTVIQGAENLFEQLCEENNIKYSPYPKPFENIYSVECEKEKLEHIGYCIFTLEEMPEITLS
ncbi:hypothetical protein [Clostridium botulinum]|uniref:hypothetical protein n=1 Tax=Clostridium botulinum TaxID=1491 RepID=UPI00090CA1CE|nr:hypothetical protein [Clostridium botulinum]APH19824.1 hypothetical protein NPD3_1892 [Clostridium botulinum]